MRIPVIGRGSVGGGLADLWERAGHEVDRIGRDGGDVSTAEAVLVAVPGDAIAEALDVVEGIEGKTAIDATNLCGGAEPPAGFASNAEFVRSRTNGPTAKSFNANYAPYDRLADAGSTPSNLWCGGEEPRAVVERLNRDTGYEPVYAGPLENAAAQEPFLQLVFAIEQGGMGPFLYRMGPSEPAPWTGLGDRRGGMS